MAGSTVCTAPGVWTAGLFWGVSGTVNCCATTSDNFAISGLVVLPGSQAPTAAQSPLIMRPFDQELATCQRYYEKSWDYAATANSLPGSVGISVNYTVAGVYALFSIAQYSVRKRANPTLNVFSPSTGVVGKARDVASNADVTPSIQFPGEKGFIWGAGCAASQSAPYFILHYTADARL
jgi:hypothetical protein